MSIGAPTSSIAAPQPVRTPVLATSDDKRLQLQTALLRKSLELQQTQADEAAQTQGKGQLIDLRF